MRLVYIQISPNGEICITGALWGLRLHVVAPVATVSTVATLLPLTTLRTSVFFHTCVY